MTQTSGPQNVVVGRLLGEDHVAGESGLQHLADGAIGSHIRVRDHRPLALIGLPAHVDVAGKPLHELVAGSPRGLGGGRKHDGRGLRSSLDGSAPTERHRRCQGCLAHSRGWTAFQFAWRHDRRWPSHGP